jgi:hypothetical protein
MKKYLGIILILIIGLSLSACSSLADSDQIDISSEDLLLDSSNSIGQTFIPNYAGLNGIQIHLLPAIEGNGEIHFSLLERFSDEKALATISKPIREIKESQFYKFEFAAIKGKNLDNLYLKLTIDGEGSVFVSTGDKNAYLNGAIYIDDQPIDAQMAFQLEYDPMILIWGLIKEFLGWGYKFFLSVLVFVIPGLALLNLLWPSAKTLSKLERIAIAVGVSIAFYPIFFLWTDLIGIHLGVGYAWIPLVLGSVYLIWINRIGIIETIKSPGIMRIRLRNANKEVSFWQDLTLLIVLFFIFMVRFWVIRDLAGPMWGDSYHHTMISQLLVDNKGLFNSWLPYAELGSFTYHFGFHSAVAVFHWISGEGIVDSILWVGQVMNGMSVFVLYPLVMALNQKNRWGAIAAVLVAGLLLSYPMFYVNWGRYTQITGQTILPILMIYFFHLIKQEKIDWKFLFLGGIVVTGLALTHYRVFILAVLFCLVSLVLYIQKDRARRTLLNILFLSVLSLIMFLPWLFNLWGGNLAKGTVINIGSPVIEGIQPIDFIRQLVTYYPLWIWITFILVVIISIIKFKKNALVLFIWSVFLILIVNPHWLRLPGEGIIDDLTVLIGFYIPLTVLLGLLVTYVISGIPILGKLSPKIYLILILILSIYGFNLQRTIVNQHMYAYLTKPDLKAIKWLGENASLEDKVLVNYEFSYGGGAITGVDAGWWIPLLTQRMTNLPPITFTSEKGISDNYYNEIMEFAINNASSDLTDLDVIENLTKRGYRFLFIGQNALQTPLFYPQELMESQHYSLIYHHDQVRIFEINE